MRRSLGLAILLFCFPLGCKEDGRKADEKAKEAPGEPPPAIRVSADRKDLVFSYASEGGFSTATALEQIPDASRRAVVVTDLSLTPEQRQSGRYIYIADLR